MDDSVVAARTPSDMPANRPPAHGRRRAGAEVFRSAHVMGWIALSSLAAAIFLSVVIAIARGQTAPLYVTWVSALIMAAVSGVIAAFIIVTDRARANRPAETEEDRESV
ncbi:MAG: hypothetical protein ACRDKW_11185 [Actinomycetota bacterium]